MCPYADGGTVGTNCFNHFKTCPAAVCMTLNERMNPEQSFS